MRLLITFLAAWVIFGSCLAQNMTENLVLEWSMDERTSEMRLKDGSEGRYGPSVPILFRSIDIPSGQQVKQVRITSSAFQAFSRDLFPDDVEIETDVLLQWDEVAHRGKPRVDIRVFPYRQGNGRLERLVEGVLEVEMEPIARSRSTNGFTTQSRLASGIWFRIPISRDGIYSLNSAYLTGLGLDVSSLDPSSLNIYGNDEGQLPYDNAEARLDDLQPKPILITGEGDGSFDSGDRVIFYAKGPDEWTYDADQEEFVHQKHAFSERSYVFLGIGIDPPLRIQTESPLSGQADLVLEEFDDYSFHEEDLENIIKSGRRAVGEKFGLSGSLDYSGSTFNFENIVTDESVKIRLRATSKTFGIGTSSTTTFTAQGNTQSITINGFSPTAYLGARSSEGLLQFQPASGNLSVSCSFNPGTVDAEGWVDFIRLNVKRSLRRTSAQLRFRSAEALDAGLVRYRISNMDSNRNIWEVNAPGDAREISFELDGDMATFLANGGDIREYVVWDSSNLIAPSQGVALENQNLHAVGQQDMVIVTAAPFRSMAENLADLHRADGLDVYVTTPQPIYNEFSCGTPDITAIKMFMKMLYDRAEGDDALMPDYLLLIGDGTYENLGIDPNSSIYLPTYQSRESNSLTTSYVSDDYFGYLDDSESEGTDGALDIGIGRFPVKSSEEANAVYQKIIRYTSRQTGVIGGVCNENAQTSFGPWRNKVVLIGDDEDTNRHMSQADDLGDRLESVDSDYEIEKIFLDAYVQESTPGGARYPEAAEDLRRSIDEGAILVSYTGHGGEVGWAQERILDVPTIQAFTNSRALPVMLTATCEFSRFDDPGRTSAGELILLNPEGGVISLFTTTRLVYSQPNFDLSMNFFDVVMRKDAEDYQCSVDDFTFPHGLRMGDIMRVSKNCTTSNPTNKLNFSLLGDPALRISYPEMFIQLDSILNTQGQPLDTISALQKVRVTGEVIDAQGQILDGFEGILDTRVFDKPRSIQTLSNDNGNPFNFELQNSIIYNGRASVQDGRFEFEFIVPRDIRYDEGRGKMVFYAISDDTDAQGSAAEFYVSGTNANAEDDDTGPTLEIAFDSEDFVDGGLTNESPWLLVDLFDENGINTVGNGIGHDITLTIDGNTAERIVLNDFYTADLDSYQSGTIRFQLNGLEEGPHTVELKAWDIYNNSSEVRTDFVVERVEDLVLDRVVNYPNPFTTNTQFMFEHNQSCDALNVSVEVFTVSGKLVKTIHRTIDTNRAENEPILWDGRDEYGDRLGRGVYVYKLEVATPTGQREEVFEKLVIL